MAKYKLAKNGVIDQENNMFIPNDPANRYWQEYQQWLAQGNTPDSEYTLDDLKQQKISQLKADFNKLPEYGYYSQTINKKINARYTDLLNMKSLLEFMTLTGQQKVEFRCYDNTFVEIDQNELRAMIKELIAYGLICYKRKWLIEQAILNCETETCLQQIQWDEQLNLKRG